MPGEEWNEERCQNLCGDACEAKEAVAEKAETYAAQMDELMTLGDQLFDNDVDQNTLLQELDAAEGLLQDAIQNLEEWQNSVLELESELQSLNEQLSELQRTLEILTEVLNSKYEEQAGVADEMQEFWDELERIVAALDALPDPDGADQEEYEFLLERYATVEADLSALQQQYDALQGEADAIHGEIDGVEGQIDAIRDAINAAESALGEANDVIEGEQTFIEDTAVEIEGLQSAVSSLENDAERIQGEIDALNEETGGLYDLMLEEQELSEAHEEHCEEGFGECEC